MKESDLNRHISKSLKKDYEGFKIQDGLGGISTSSPFDGIGAIPGIPIYFESKLLKNKIQSLNFKKIEDHQIKALTGYKKLLPFSLSIVTVGIFIPRKLYKLFVLDINLVNYFISINKKSILKKEWELLVEKNMYITMKRENSDYIFDPLLLKEKLITIDYWNDHLTKE